ncbi:hypothetical protein ACFRAU_07395 [Arthrobacter sp. NPDC056691]|uniref:hypothetical protein n=1 Tax=Arthrobacter sp. NPDC056691 TaxID=3345913 RepID=UPI003671A1A4
MLDENSNGQHHAKRQGNKTQRIIARAKALYSEKPTAFAFGIIGVSAVSFLLGTLLLGGIHYPFMRLEP